MLSFEDKRPTNISSAQVKLSSCSKERKIKLTDYVILVEVTPTNISSAQVKLATPVGTGLGFSSM